MSSATRMALDERHDGAAPGRHPHGHAQVLWSLRGALALEVDGRRVRLGTGQAVLLARAWRPAPRAGARLTRRRAGRRPAPIHRRLRRRGRVMLSR